MFLIKLPSFYIKSQKDDQQYDNRDRGYSRSYDRQPSYPSNDGGKKKKTKISVQCRDNNELGMQKIDDTIYISNLPQDVTEEKLAAHFGSIGIIKTDKKLRKPKSKNISVVSPSPRIDPL